MYGMCTQSGVPSTSLGEMVDCLSPPITAIHGQISLVHLPLTMVMDVNSEIAVKKVAANR